jgi:SNF2 family DNA or RNA helicase
VLLVNYEAVASIITKVLRIPWDRVVYDEAHRLKNRNSQASRAARRLRNVPRRLALTGTPMDLSPRDLWAIMRFVNHRVFGEHWKTFEEYYIEQPNIDPKKAKGAIARKKAFLQLMVAKRKAPMRKDRIDEFAKLLASHVMRISKEEAGIEPAKVTKFGFEMKGRQERLYRQLEKSMVAKWKDITVKTPLKITQMAKLQQITGGFMIDEERETHRVGKGKLELLRKLVAFHIDDEPFVVFCKYRREIEDIERMLREMGYRRIAKLWGKVKDTKTKKIRTEMLLNFQRGKYDVMIAQQKTGGVGVDLFHARKAFVYSMGHSFIDYDQMMSRLDFMGQDEQGEFFLLYAKQSIDEDIIKAVLLKTSVANVTFDRLKQHSKGP